MTSQLPCRAKHTIFLVATQTTTYDKKDGCCWEFGKTLPEDPSGIFYRQTYGIKTMSPIVENSGVYSSWLSKNT